jgi:DNA-binding transcriptional LysR family regulator
MWHPSGVSQSAITPRCNSSKRTGQSAFLASSQGVSLTPKAPVLQLARNIMAAVNEAMRTPLAEDMKQSGKVRVGVTYTVAGYFLPPHPRGLRGLSAHHARADRTAA